MNADTPSPDGLTERTPRATRRRPLGAGGGHVEGVRSIAVLRGGGLGDLVFALPALESLRAAYPSARITLLGTAWQSELLSSRPSPVDRVVPLPPIPGITAPPDESVDEDRVDRVARELEAERFDIAIQMHGGGRHSNPFVRRIRARLTIGLRTPDAEALDRTVPYIYYQPEVLRALEVVGLVGAAPVELEPRLAVTEADRVQARRVLGGAPAAAAAARPLVVLHPGAGDPRRRWPAASFAAVGDALAGQGVDVAVTGSAAERQIVRDLIDRMQSPAIDLAGRLDLAGLVGVLDAADLVISNDSGPLHLAMAVGSSTIGVFWCGNLINAGPFSRGRHRPAISWQLDCPVCGVDCTRGTCPHRESFVGAVEPREVLDAAVDLLGTRASKPASPPASPPILAPADQATAERSARAVTG